MSFKSYWNWKHTLLIVFFIGNAFYTSAGAPTVELVATVVLTPLIAVVAIYWYWSARVKDKTKSASA